MHKSIPSIKKNPTVFAVVTEHIPTFNRLSLVGVQQASFYYRKACSMLVADRDTCFDYHEAYRLPVDDGHVIHVLTIREHSQALNRHCKTGNNNPVQAFNYLCGSQNKLGKHSQAFNNLGPVQAFHSLYGSQNGHTKPLQVFNKFCGA